MAKLSLSFWTLCVLLLASVFVFAEEAKQPSPPELEISTKFVDNPLNLIINGQRNNLEVMIKNNEKHEVALMAVSGSLTVPGEDKIFRNLTAVRYTHVITPGQNASVRYNFYSEFNPADYQVEINVDVLAGENYFRVNGFEGVVSVIDPEASLLDPQLLFLYVILAAAAAGVAYLIREAYFGGATKKKTSAKKNEVVEKAAHRDEKGNMVLDQSWIPDHHLKSSPSQSPRVKKRAGRK
ncbi:hypothetical protein BC940DRAFT_309911 [Gongronella butleri]|nr:hypothetical protein BC940DRAFT_309911 [Gongronella butleri]